MAALGNFGSSWEVLGEPGEVSRELWEAPYIDKTPDQPHSGRYVIITFDICGGPISGHMAPFVANLGLLGPCGP